MRVSFEFNPETRKVSNVEITDDTNNTNKRAVKKILSSTALLNGSSLKLNQEILDNLKVKIGDRLCLRFDPRPKLVRPDVLNEKGGGYLITKSMTIACKGIVGQTLSYFGKEFTYQLISDGYLSLDNSRIVTSDEVNSQEDTQQSHGDIIVTEDMLKGFEDNEKEKENNVKTKNIK